MLLSFSVAEEPATDAAADISDQIGEVEIAIGVGFGMVSTELDLLDVLLEEPVIDEGVFPLGNQLSFELLGEFHHFPRKSKSLDFEEEEEGEEDGNVG